MTPKEIDTMPEGDELDYQVALAMGQTVFTHLTPQWMEGYTEDGKDGWDGFYCPRCGIGIDVYVNCAELGEKCVKHYSRSYKHIEELLKWLISNSGDLFIEYWQDGEWYLCNKDLQTRHDRISEVIRARSGKVGDDELPNLPLALCRFILKVALANKE